MAQADTLRWQGKQDKIGPEHVAPMVEVARAVLLAERRRRANGRPLTSRPRNAQAHAFLWRGHGVRGGKIGQGSRVFLPPD